MLRAGSRTRGESPARRRLRVTALSAGAVLLVAAVAWLLIGVPALVKYPTDLDVRLHAEGTFTLLVDPNSAAPLAEPLLLPLTVDRHIRGDEGQSSSSTAIVHETIDQRAGDVVDITQTNAYVMDRSSVENVADERAFAFEPGNVVDRSGTYRLNLPFGTSRDDQLPIYKNEIGTSYRMSGDTRTPTDVVNDLELLNFTAAVTDAPITDAYFNELNKMAPMPRALTPHQLRPHLLNAGFDLDGLRAALGPRLSPADTATLTAFAAEPIPLQYVLSFEGSASVEPTTGAEVRVGSDESIGVIPRPARLAMVQELLGRHPDVPEAATARAALERITAGRSIPLFEYRFEQTAASVDEIADLVASQRRQVQLARVLVPVTLVVAGVLCLAVGALLLVTRPKPT